MSRNKWILTAVGVVIVAIIGWRVVGGHGGGEGFGFDGEDDNAPVPVTVVPATASNVPTFLQGPGTVQSINSVNVQPQVGGQLLKLDFVEGKPVVKGQVLAEIDPRTIEAQLDQARAKRAQDGTQLATAKANLERSMNPKYAPYVAQIDRITQQNTVAQWQAAVAADDASIRDTSVQLGFTKVTSPIDGVAGIRQVDPGNVITTGSTIVTVTQMHPINVVFTLASPFLDEVRAAQAKAPLSVAVLDASNKVVEADGVLKVIDNQIDPGSGQFKLKAEFPNTDNGLFPGQYVPVRLKVGVDDHALVVPTAAVQRGPDGSYVWLLTNTPPPGTSAPTASSSRKHRWRKAPASSTPAKPVQYVTMQAVTTGGEAGDASMIITHGLKAGDLVVSAGQFRLKDGSAVMALKPGEIPPPPTTAELKAASKQQGGRHGRHGP